MNYKKYSLCFTLVVFSFINPIDNPHFYRATNMFPEPRLEHDYLLTMEATLAGGSTSQGRSGNNTIVPLFDIYGLHSLQDLARNNPFISADEFDQLLKNLSLLPTRTDFATLSIDGSFHIIESNLSLTQNFGHGLFLFFHLPVRQLKINNIQFIDLSPDDSVFPNKNTPEWQAVLKNFNPILNHLGIDTRSKTTVGVGDLTTFLGWSHNYQETKTLDFIDVSCMAGFLSPTGKMKNEREIFSLPTGYNGHWAFPLSASLSLGFYEWVTLGAYFNTLFFLDKERVMPLKTDYIQQGIIRPIYGEVSEHRGPLVHSGLYFKADHVGHGVSVTVAYSFASQQKIRLTPKNNELFNKSIINSDESLKGWNMHTFNFLADYDFAREGSKFGNRIGLFYNLQIAGSRTFVTNMVGGMWGIDISVTM